MTLEQELAEALAGRYRLERELGRGGMATVLQGHDLRHDRSVAIKVLLPEIAAAFGAERFLREIQIAARLSHPHILPLHDSGQAGRLVYYVMPFVAGESLRDRLRREGQLPLEDVLQVGREVGGALAYAHSHDIVHRDIKPENILFHGGHAVVVDFGIGRALGSSEAAGLTQPGITLGTPGYMSPEQAAGGLVDGRSDVYALGCVLYELLTGRRPDPPAVRGPGGASPRTHRSAVPAWLDRAIQRALERLPADRFPTAGQLVTALTPAPSSGARPTPSIAVLPFANLGGDQEAEYFSDGITEEIINALARVDTLRVASRTSAFAFKNRGEDVRAIGERLNVAAVLEGSVRRAGSRLRITAQLVSTGDGLHLWGDRYDREMADIFAIQDEIARAMVQVLQVRLGDEPDRPMVQPPTEDLQAYTLYLRGRHHWNRRYEVGLHRGLESFLAAIERDPDYALAHAGVADSYSVLGFYGYLPPATAFARARAAADRVRSLDDTLPEAHFSRGLIAFWHDWDFSAAEAAFETTLALRPTDAEAQVFVSQVRCMLGDFSGAQAAADRARALDPDSPLILAMAAWPAYVAGRYEEAVGQCDRALEIDAGFLVALWVRALALIELGRHEEAMATAARGVALSQRSTFMVSTHGCTLARAGDRAGALAALAELGARAAQGYVAPFHNAVIYASLGDAPRAIEELERSVADRTPNVVTAGTLPLFRELQGMEGMRRVRGAVGV